MKHILIFALLFAFCCNLKAQSVYCNDFAKNALCGNLIALRDSNENRIYCCGYDIYERGGKQFFRVYFSTEKGIKAEVFSFDYFIYSNFGNY